MLLLVFQLAHQISCGRLKLASAKLVAAVLVQFLLLDVVLDLRQHHGPFDAVVAQQVPTGLAAVGVVLHPQGDRPPRLGPTSHLVELEAHESLDEGRLSRRLVPDHHHRYDQALA